MSVYEPSIRVVKPGIVLERCPGIIPAYREVMDNPDPVLAFYEEIQRAKEEVHP